MSKTQTLDPADIICGLKAAVTALECHHNMQLLRKQQEPRQRKPPPPPMYVMVPIEEETKAQKRARSTPVANLRKRNTCNTGINKRKKPEYKDPSYIPGLRFPEMRAGVLYSRCSCVHRDGLQDSCPLTQCQGQPECLTKPWPVCPPGKFTRARYPDLYPTNSNVLVR